MEQLDYKQFLILVVDDSKINLKVVGAILNKVGYKTTFAIGGQDAIERLKSVKPDLILLDLMMPDMDGIEVCNAIKNQLENQDIPVIFLTANIHKENLLDAFKNGAVDYIVKPFHRPEFLARIRIHLELKHTRDELKKALIEQEKLATTDPLTNIANRRYFFTQAEAELKRSRRYHYSFSVLMMDIDHFRDINNTYGHAIGDEAIKIVATKIIKNIRDIDICARIGGEEFVALLPQTNMSEAMVVAERIRQIISQTVITAEEQKVTMTMSIGVATYAFEDETIDAVLKRADKALYQAKNAGRNQVVNSDQLTNYGIV